MARELLEELKQLLVINWRPKSTARSQVRLAIEDVLDHGLPRVYSPDLYYETYADKGGRHLCSEGLTGEREQRERKDS